MLYPDTMSVAQAQTMLVRRPPDGYPSVAIFLNGASGIVPDTGGDGQLSVTSGWFALTIDVNLNGTQLKEHALIDATRLPARLVSRQWGEQT